MKTRLFVICILCSFLFAIVLFFLQSNQSSLKTIKYFPLNDTYYFSDADTILTAGHNEIVDWAAASTAETAMYLRHDVSLLYENGFFKGVQSKWQQDQKEISFSQAVPLHETSIFEAISFHHGEIHRSPSEITSIQQMTFDKIYLNKQGEIYEPLKGDNKLIPYINEQRNERLMSKWNELIAHYEITDTDYQKIPLVNLADYEESPLPGLSTEKSKETIGKLWEGLYKNYILPLKEKQNQTKTHVMPLVMLSKDGTHLYVLFELNDRAEILLQQIEQSSP